ncbi:malate:quinone oxidoreductase [Corynebacterium kutscheri]|uniref:malate dehydrogenase (quinone) n=1 Tax=Corynebacterium kutscheri TaxID=35755 RepID=UPI000F6FE073|nr:malate dehydrogenase (quinone) [Corynebacterium kutscheri]VEH79862.1 malate:quinone oxidoreductase [Corynebacterium kutscheri]
MADSPQSVTSKATEEVDVLLIGAGIMSATLGAILQQLEPSWSQLVLERLAGPAQESSSPWNNAGTGHSALCELNYTPETKSGKVKIEKAVDINEKFQVSRQFWSHQLEAGVLSDAKDFINPVPHVSFGRGEQQIEYLHRRYEALKNHPLFPGMSFISDHDEFADRLPLMAAGRDKNEKVVVSWINSGTDVNFGSLSQQFFASAAKNGAEVRYGHEVTNIKGEGTKWKVTVKDLHTGDIHTVLANFVFVGAGGMALPLLQKSGIIEIRGWGGFPVSGLWLRCTNEELIAQHHAKVYGQAAIGAPPMSVPHLDTRVIDGKTGLLFGPYAGWTPKFLKTGSWFDLFKSIRPTNLLSYVGVGLQEFSLTKYLLTELMMDKEAKMESLREYVPQAQDKDWEIVVAGQRVQAIQPVVGPRFSTLAFGTTLINNGEGTIAGLLGASPGASIAPSAMIELIERCFGHKMIEWGPKLKEMIPSYGTNLSADPALFAQQWERTQKTLKLED